MGLAETFKKLFVEPPKRMAGASINILTALPAASYCYEIERAAKRLDLRGWIELKVDGTVQSELEGSYDGIESLLKQLESGRLVPGRPALDMMWLPYRSKFVSLRIKIF